MNKSPLVSVVIPTFNQPGLLLETLAGVFAQTLDDYEVVVVNDGSTDDTLARLKPYEGRIRVVTQPNGGIGVARNRGIAEARGKYVALLDHDDLWMPEKLAEQVRYYEAHRECSVVSVRWASTKDAARCLFPEEVVEPDGKIRRPLHVLAQSQLILVTSAIMFDREKARGLAYATRRNCIEDTPFQIGLMGRGEFGIAGDKILMLYREHAQNYSSQASFFYNGLLMLRDMDRAHGFPEITGATRRDLDEFLSSIGRYTAVKQLRSGQRRRAWAVYLREWRAQVRWGRARFLLWFPILSFMPQHVLRKVWP